MPLSVTIITRDEADRLPRALASVAFADEIVVLDSGSTDGTVRLAREAGCTVVQTDWPGHVAQKNRALEQASHDWVLALDADEHLSPDLAALIQQALEHPTADAYRVPRLSWWLGAPLRHGTWYPDRRVRLFRRSKARFVGGDPHDRVEVDGTVADLAADLLHHPYRDLSEHLQTIDRYTALSVRQLRDAGRRAHWWDVVFRPPLHFAKAVLLRAGFLDGVRGWCVAGLGATYVLVKWTRLYLEPGR